MCDARTRIDIFATLAGNWLPVRPRDVYPRLRTPDLRQRRCCAHSDDFEPDWDVEMSIFKKRTLKPSQLEALRKLEEEKNDVGRVCLI